MDEKRYMRVQRLVKLGIRIPGSGSYACEIEGRPTYGSEAFNKSFNKCTIILTHTWDDRLGEIVHGFSAEVYTGRKWRHLHPRLQQMLELIFWEKLL